MNKRPGKRTDATRRSGAGPSRTPSRTAGISEPVEVVIDRLGSAGDGLAQWQDLRLFVPQALPGDRLMVRIGAARKDGWEAEPLTLLQEGPGRADPPCSHFGSCGGCALQHLTDSSYVDWKLSQLTMALDRAGLLTDVVLKPLVRTPPGGRRRATLAAARRGRRLWLGFNERSAHRLVDLTECPVLAPELTALFPRLRMLLAGLLPDGGTLDLAITLLDDGIDLLLIGLTPPGLTELESLGRFAEEQDLARLSWCRKPGAAVEPIARRRTGFVRFGAVTVSPPPGGFLQASRQGEMALQIAALAGSAGAGSVADLFAGCGTLTFPLAEHSKVLAVEGDELALHSLQTAARSLPPGQVTGWKRDLFREPMTAPELNCFDCVIFDPPRAGAAAQTAELAASRVPALVALSCNPASFIRDARVLQDGGYRLRELTPIDQFLWSPHLELAALFSR
jgi:23S rRNA (uracil1939-C5)-methyltransferase